MDLPGLETHQTVDNIGSPVQMRSRFNPNRKKESTKKVDKPDRPSLLRKTSFKKN